MDVKHGRMSTRPATSAPPPTNVTAARRALGLALTAIALVTTVGAALAVPAQAATPQTTYVPTRIDAPTPQDTGRWAERTAVANDLDGDNVNDYFVADLSLDIAGETNRGRVYAMSGRTGKILYRINSPEPQENSNFGFFISTFGDVDDDGKTDIAIGTDAQNVGANAKQGKAWVFSGVDGSLLYAIDNPAPQSDGRFGSRIGAAGDVTGDDVRDVLIGASNNDLPAGCAEDGTVEAGCYKNIGQAFIFDGATGALVRTLDVPAIDRTAANGTSCSTRCGSFGIAVQSPGDTNSDGIDDQLVGASSFGGVGRMFVFDGATGNVRLRVDPPEPQAGSNWSFQDAAPGAPGDITGDGNAELYANGFTHDGPAGPGQGRAWIFNGETGALIRAIDDPVPTDGGQFGWSVDKLDYNKDGVPDQYIGQSPHHVPNANQDGGTYVFDGRDGKLLKSLEVPAGDTLSTDNNGGRLGWTATAPGDLNGDGEPDFLGGAPFLAIGSNLDQGRLYVFLSQVPKGPATPPAPIPAPAPGPAPSATTGKFAAKLSLARARLVRRDRVLDVLAPITARASGRVKVELHAAGQRFRFTTAIDSANGRIRFRQRIPKAQADLGTGIITIEYAGDADTKPQTVRLRAAAQKANLNLSRPTIVGGRLKASGTVSDDARGVVRLQVQYDYLGETRDLSYQARIENGKWEIDEQLSPTVLLEIAARQGSVHSYTLFTGYLPKRMRGEMRSFQVLGER